MKTLLIGVLALALLGALFFTRPTSADFQKYIRENTKIVNGAPTGGQTVADKIGAQFRTLVASTANETAADLFLKQCQYENNYFLWTNVSKDGKLIYTGVLGHWFERNGGAGGSK
jgi:hypothetical protein